MTQPNGGGGMTMLTPERRSEIAQKATKLSKERRDGFPDASKDPKTAWEKLLFGRRFDDVKLPDSVVRGPWA